MGIRFGLLLIMGAAIGGTLNAWSHQQKAAISSVMFNERTNNIEVVHRFSLHDAEHAVKRVINRDADIYASKQTQTNFADYVTQHFSIEQGSGEPITLSQIGFELEGKFFWVYQEAPIPEHIQEWQITNKALHEIWPEQMNTVNIEWNGKISTLTLNRQQASGAVVF
jgi:hypothetical protein